MQNKEIIVEITQEEYEEQLARAAPYQTQINSELRAVMERDLAKA